MKFAMRCVLITTPLQKLSNFCAYLTASLLLLCIASGAAQSQSADWYRTGVNTFPPLGYGIDDGRDAFLSTILSVEISGACKSTRTPKFCRTAGFGNVNICTNEGDACESGGVNPVIPICKVENAVPITRGSVQSRGFYNYEKDLASCACPEITTFDRSTGYCEPSSPSTLTLSGPTETRPAGTGGVSTATLGAKVAAGGVPKSGVALSFSVDVTANSGGHEHHDINRPKGTLSNFQGVTDANGEVKLTFQAPESAGTHTIKANCTTCSNSVESKDIQVKVPNLVEMLPDTGKPATYTLVGATGNHKSNHWFTTSAGGVLQKVTDAMFKTGWGAVGVNDGSLVWGGLFDIKGGWTPPHSEHRMGTEVDLSVTNPRNVTDDQKKKTYAELCKKDNAAFSIQTLWHQDDGYPEHFHMYLDGTGLDSQAKGGPCCARYKTTRAKVDKNGKPVMDKTGKPVQETVSLCEETSPR